MLEGRDFQLMLLYDVRGVKSCFPRFLLYSFSAVEIKRYRQFTYKISIRMTNELNQSDVKLSEGGLDSRRGSGSLQK